MSCPPQQPARGGAGGGGSQGGGGAERVRGTLSPGDTPGDATRPPAAQPTRRHIGAQAVLQCPTPTRARTDLQLLSAAQAPGQPSRLARTLQILPGTRAAQSGQAGPGVRPWRQSCKATGRHALLPTFARRGDKKPSVTRSLPGRPLLCGVACSAHLTGTRPWWIRSVALFTECDILKVRPRCRVLRSFARLNRTPPHDQTRQLTGAGW